ncbi:MAG: glycerol-3-phosphate 1-O-acyltransferase PlsY [Lachnospiraceae bacterium]|jgi:glycerol-3-phosphate acyltransferase PlsY|nr:glycerol-3-phosphate 1-O-acyltransferase PlsY [Lachnospiraceae bacterium]
MDRVLCLVIGYAFGLIQTGYIYGKLHNVDIRKAGSGNAGSTNALRTMGLKAGVTTLLGDILKTVLAIVVAHLIFNMFIKNPMPYELISLYTGLGVVLGHNFPFYLHFKGGKGIAATGGVILATLDPISILICGIIFIGTVALTRYVSLGSILLVITYLIITIVKGICGNLDINSGHMIEYYIVVCVFVGLALFRHRGNINRLIHHKENKLSLGKKNK